MKKKLLIITLSIIYSLSCLAQTPNWLPENGLIAWYPFNGNANDESGNGNNGTNNGATLSTDKYGNVNSAYIFNGISGHIAVADTPALRLSNTDFTISLWVYQTSTSSTYQNAIITKRYAGQKGYFLGITGPASNFPNKIDYQVSGGTDPYALSNSNTILNVWQHIMICYTLSQTKVEIYINGVLNATKTNMPIPNATTDAQFWIGNDVLGQQYCFNGKIDNIAIYNRVLEPCEINQVYRESSINITMQPSNQNINSGGMASFAVTAGDTCLNYQWQVDEGAGWQNLSDNSIYSGSITDSLMINTVLVAMNNYQYRCIINSCLFCIDTTDAKVLSVNTGTKKVYITSFANLSPNPFSDELNISVDDDLPSRIIIYDMTSKGILEQEFTVSSSINTSHLPKGFYFYELRNKYGVLEKGKLIKD